MSHPELVSSDSASSVQLPPELWILVLSQIWLGARPAEQRPVIARLDPNQYKRHGEQVLHNVSLTCRSLHDLSLPIRFAHVELHAVETEMNEARPTELYIRLSNSGKYRNFVKVGSLYVYGDELPDSTRDILCGMHNLEDVRMIIPFQMTTPLHSHICSLHSLHRLEVTLRRQNTRALDDITPLNPNHIHINSLLIKYGGTESEYQEYP